MRKFTTAIVLYILTALTLAIPPGPVPRKAPELTFFDASAKPVSLSSFKGKVVALEFFFMRSLHCVRVAQTLNTLNDELGSRGFQAVAVAFSAPHSEADAATVDSFLQTYRLAFPVGYTDMESVDRFLSRTQGDVLMIPQVVIIDRTGMIRAQSGNRPGDATLEDIDSLRTRLNALLKEPLPPTTPAAPVSPPKTGPAKTKVTP